MSAQLNQATAARQQENISNAVTRLFTDLKRDMDRIVNGAEFDRTVAAEGATTQEQQHSPPPAAGGDAGPVLRLSHGRTASEAPAYDDYELPNPLGKLPEAIIEVEDSQDAAGHIQGAHAQQATANTAAAPGRSMPLCAAAEAEALLANVMTEHHDTSMQDHGTAASREARSAQDGTSAHMQQQQSRSMRQQLQDELQYMQEDIRRQKLLSTAPAGSGAGQRGSEPGSDEAAEFELEAEGLSVSRQLSYKELLDRALAWNPRVKGAAPLPSSGSAAGSGHSSMWVSAELPRRSSTALSTSSTSSRRPRPSSTGRMPRAGYTKGALHSPPDYKTKLQDVQKMGPPQHSMPRPGRSKFPAAQQHSSHFSLAEQHRPQQQAWGVAAVPGSKMAREVAADPQGAGAQRPILQGRAPQKPQAQYRSRSAPREEAAARRHVERMNGSPSRVRTSRDSILSQQQQQKLVSAPWQLQQGDDTTADRRSSARSPDAQLPMRLTKQELSSASNRLNQYVSGRQDIMCRSQQQQQAAVAFGSTARSPRTSPGPAERMAGPPSPPGPLDPSFYRRQEALLQRRAELAAQRRESDEDDLTECTFQPHINPSSRNLQRSVEQLHAWDARRRLTVFAKALDKCEHECDKHTFAPSINPLSRQLALANYAVAPDPLRPWTKSPKHTSPRPRSPQFNSPSPDAMRILRDTLPPANVIMMAGPTAQQKAESVMDMLAGTSAAPSAAARHFARSAARSPEPTWPKDDSGHDYHSPIMKGASLMGPASHSPRRAQQTQQQQQDERQAGQQAAEDYTNGSISVCVETSPSKSSATEAVDCPVLESDTVLGVPAKMPAMGVPVAVTAPGVVTSAAPTQRISASANSDAGLWGSGGGTAAAGDGTILVRIAAGDVADKAAAAGDAAAGSPMAPSAGPGGPQVCQKKSSDIMEPQLLLAALKLTPVQAQQGLEEGRSCCSSNGGATKSLAGAAAAATAARSSSCGGMAPGTPLIGSLGGCDGAAAPFAKPTPGAMRDDSAGGMYSATIAKRLSAGDANLSAAQHAAAAHKANAGSPLSRCPQGLGPAAGSKGACPLEELALQLGCSPDKAAHQMRGAGLQTVPAYYYSAAEQQLVPAAVEAVKRPSSYSEKYKKRLSSGSSTKALQSQAAVAVPDSLSLTAGSDALAGSRRSNSSGGGYASGSPPLSPNFAEIKAKWVAKEAASQRTSAAGGRSGYSSPTKTSVGGARGVGHSGGGAGPDAATLQHLSSSLVAAPGTPMHGQQQQQLNPFTATPALWKQYSTAQVLNARARHSSCGGMSSGGRGSCGGAAAADASAQAAAQCVQDAAVTAAYAAVAPMQGQILVMLTNDSPAADTCTTSSNGQNCQGLAACSSVISVPDASAGAAAVGGESCNGTGCVHALVTHKVEVLLEGTQSVPFELILSPRSKFLLASNPPGSSCTPAAPVGPTTVDIDSSLGQHLLQLLKAGQVPGGAQGEGAAQPVITLTTSQWQELQQQQQRGGLVPAAAAAAAPVVDAAVPSSCPAVASVAKALEGSADDACDMPQLLGGTSGSPAWGTPTSSCRPMATAQQQLQQQKHSPAEQEAPNAGTSRDATSPMSSTSPDRAEATALAAAAGDSSPQQQQQQQEEADGDADGCGDLAAELAALLKSAGSMSPEEKADRLARTFSKTISRLNMPSTVLQQTIAVLDATAKGSTSTTSVQLPATSAAPAQTAEAASDPAAAASHPGTAAALQADPDMPDLPEADNMQQLLARMSIGGLLGAGQSAAVPEQQAEPNAQAAATTATALATAALSAAPAAPAAAAASAAARTQSTSPTGKSWAAVAASHHSSM